MQCDSTCPVVAAPVSCWWACHIWQPWLTRECWAPRRLFPLLTVGLQRVKAELCEKKNPLTHFLHTTGKKKCSSPSARTIKRHPMQKNESLLKSHHQACLQTSVNQMVSLPILEKKKGRHLMETRHLTIKMMIWLYSWDYILKRSYLFQFCFILFFLNLVFWFIEWNCYQFVKRRMFQS